jgi:hypothetical protein
LSSRSTFYSAPFELCGRTIGQLAMATLFSSTVVNYRCAQWKESRRVRISAACQSHSQLQNLLLPIRQKENIFIEIKKRNAVTCFFLQNSLFNRLPVPKDVILRP